MSAASESYTCLTCCVSFKDSSLQRQHHKSDWHWYNLKRKVVSLPPVNPEEFKTKVIEQKQKDLEAEKAHNFYCQICRKKFNSDNAFSTHTKSKKHLLVAAKQPKENRVIEEDEVMTTPDNDVAVERCTSVAASVSSVALTEDYSMIDDTVDEDDLEVISW
eukprot:sb/3472827/